MPVLWCKQGGGHESCVVHGASGLSVCCHRAQWGNGAYCNLPPLVATTRKHQSVTYLKKKIHKRTDIYSLSLAGKHLWEPCDVQHAGPFFWLKVWGNSTQAWSLPPTLYGFFLPQFVFKLWGKSWGDALFLKLVGERCGKWCVFAKQRKRKKTCITIHGTSWYMGL